MKLLHFSDAHIDMANYGRHDPVTGLPLRVLDFLKSLDTIVDAAIDEKVDMVIFAGDAYRDRSPAPTFQREWGRRIMRLSQAKIPTLLLIGNHDISPAIGRAHAIQEFDTLQVPFVRVLATRQILKPDDLWGVPVQVIALPWESRSSFIARNGYQGDELQEVYNTMEDQVTDEVKEFINQADNSIPLILTAHCSVFGATYGSERMVMLGSDLVISGSLVKSPNFDYVALGHIHKAQNLNGQGPDPKDKTPYVHPPVIYPGSIERVDFGEEDDEKFFVIAEIEKGHTNFTWRKIESTRPFVTTYVTLKFSENITEYLISRLPPPEKLKDAIVRLIVKYPREFDTLIDESALRKHAEKAFEFHLVKRPQSEARIGNREGLVFSSFSPLDLLAKYFEVLKTKDADELKKLAQEIVSEDTLDI